MPIWVKCDDCDDYWCTHHNAHAFDCSCCGIECWVEAGLDPYLEIPEGADFSDLVEMETCEQCGES
jgi:hypothetical protein